MRAGSLFAGIGGFDLGFEQAGIQTAWQVEIDDKAREVLAKRFPGAKRYADIRDVGGQLEPVDVICGGFPCQDVSVAGSRLGMVEGARSNLFYEACRIIGILQPKWVVIENVPGLFSSRGGRDFHGVVSALDELGYGVAWRVLDSQYFGVAQRRRRVFVVGHFGAPCPPEILFEPESLRRDTQPVRASGKAAPTLFASGAGTDRPASAGSESEFCIETAFALNSRNDQNEPHAETLVSMDSEYNAYDDGSMGPLNCGSPSGSGRPTALAFGWNKSSKQTMRCGESTDALQASESSNPAVLIPIKECQANRYQGVCGPGIGDDGDPMYSLGATPSNIHGIYQWASGGGDGIKDTAQALRSEAEANYQFLAGTLRRLTPTECARLQGFPDDWNDWLSDTVRYRQFGNAVTVNVARWIGERLMAQEIRRAA